MAEDSIQEGIMGSMLKSTTARRRARGAKKGGPTNVPGDTGRSRPLPGADEVKPPPGPAPRVSIFAYRQGIGDCFLLQFPAPVPGGSTHFSMMIDCGVVLGTPDAAAKMTAIVRDIRERLGARNRLDVLVVTHEHWDHLSGFIQAQTEFEGLSIGEVWLPWTEDPDDALAKSLVEQRERSLQAFRLAASRIRLAGDNAQADDLEGILGFFGAAKGASTRDALNFVRKLGDGKVRYRHPGEPPLQPIPSGGPRIFVLGPPKDEALLKRTSPHERDDEGYGLALDRFVDDVVSDSPTDGPVSPFHPTSVIPMRLAAGMDFFKSRYWEAGTTGDGWRRIDSVWASEATELALRLDSMTNNTSLVLAFELDDGDVLLFVADAQIGNWLSWQDVRWQTEAGLVTGPDLLRRAIFLKVGHHGSHNATLKKNGLEIMDNLQVCYIPVDHNVAIKKGWNRMPLEKLVDRLEKSSVHVLRSDQSTAVDDPGRIVTGDLCFEITL